MKVARVEFDGAPRLAVVVGDELRLLDVSTSAGAGHDWSAAIADENVIAASTGLARSGGEEGTISLATARLLAPVARPGKIIAVGRNYAQHAQEEGADLPTEPLVFAKFPSAIVGPDDPISWDSRITQEVDFEAELAVVIGKAARHVSREAALDYIFGYSCLNDVSARDLQFKDGQWTRAKSFDTFCPIGPWIVTADELGDPQALGISCRVSGEEFQSASTSNMIFGIRELIQRLSSWFTLDPGDVIATGTPDGVGYFRTPKRMLRNGDEVVVEIEAVGTLRNPVVVS